MNNVFQPKIRISFLDMDENLLKVAEGVATNGSINIDGASAVRRTCQLNFISPQLKGLDYFEAYKTKFLIERDLGFGFKKMGIYLLTGLSSSITTNNFTFTISGKDKMCLLNGEHGGSFPFSIDVGTKESLDYNYEPIPQVNYAPGKYYILNEQQQYVLDYAPYEELNRKYFMRTITSQKEKLTIKEIIKNIVITYGKEQPHNIFIYDLDIQGLELLEYRGSEPLYLYRNIQTGKVDKMTIDPSKDGLEENDFIFYSLSQLKQLNTPTLIDNKWNVIKIVYGQSIGYRDTDLVYAGDLTANIGENVVSILDKIKTMLGNYEYFYNEAGHFVFKKRDDYISNQFSEIDIDGLGLEYQLAPPVPSQPIQLNKVVSINQNPQFAQIKNDFSIWGTRQGTSEALPVHARVAIHNKPQEYYTFNGQYYLYDQFAVRSSLVSQYMALQDVITQEQGIAQKSVKDQYLNCVMPCKIPSNILDDTQQWFVSYFDNFVLLNSNNEDLARGFYKTLIILERIKNLYYAIFSNQTDTLPYRLCKKSFLFEALQLTPGSKLSKALNNQSNDSFSDVIKELFSAGGYSSSNAVNFGNVTDKIEELNTLGTFVLPNSDIDGGYFNLEEKSVFYGSDAIINDHLFTQNSREAKILQKIILNILIPCFYQNMAIEKKENVSWLSQIFQCFDINPEGSKPVMLKDENRGLGYFYDTTLEEKQEGSCPFKFIWFDFWGIRNSQETIIIPSLRKEVSEALITIRNNVESATLKYKEQYNNSREKTIYVSDWREIIYQMAKDYYENGTRIEFWSTVNRLNEYKYLNQNTGYEAFYEDILGFWRQLYFDPLYEDFEYELPVGYSLENYLQNDGWHEDVINDPAGLNFWIEFIEPQGPMMRYSIPSLGIKGKYENSSTVKSIAVNNPPPLKIVSDIDWELLGEVNDLNYTYVRLGGILNTYTISAQGISALERAQDLLFTHTYLQDTATLSITPTDDIQINTRIKMNTINDNEEFSVSKLTIPLVYNGLMSVTLAKIPPILTTEIIMKEFE